MTRRMIAPLLFGIVGVAILVWLGVWQVQRLAWKTAILAEIDARLAAAPGRRAAPIPTPGRDRYLRVAAARRDRAGRARRLHLGRPTAASATG